MPEMLYPLWTQMKADCTSLRSNLIATGKLWNVITGANNVSLIPSDLSSCDTRIADTNEGDSYNHARAFAMILKIVNSSTWITGFNPTKDTDLRKYFVSDPGNNDKYFVNISEDTLASYCEEFRDTIGEVNENLLLQICSRLSIIRWFAQNPTTFDSLLAAMRSAAGKIPFKKVAAVVIGIIVALLVNYVITLRKEGS